MRSSNKIKSANLEATFPLEFPVGEDDWREVEVTVSAHGAHDGIGEYEFWGHKEYQKGTWELQDISLEKIDGKGSHCYGPEYWEMVEKLAVARATNSRYELFPEPEEDDRY